MTHSYIAIVEVDTMPTRAYGPFRSPDNALEWATATQQDADKVIVLLMNTALIPTSP